jgi:hypothetical protein
MQAKVVADRLPRDFCALALRWTIRVTSGLRDIWLP